MRFIKVSLFLLIIFFSCGLATVKAQVQLERISIAERVDELGFVVRHHLTEMADSFRVARPDTNLLQFALYAPELETEGVTMSALPESFTDIELYPIETGVVIEISMADNTYFISIAYPDVNGRDVLLALEYSSPEAVARVVNADERLIRIDTDLDEAATAEQQEIVEEDEEPAIVDPPRRWNFDVGIRGGLSMSDFYGVGYSRDSRSGYSMATTFTVNMPYRLPYNIRPSLETGVYFTQKGYENPASDKFAAVVAEFDYIEVPILAKLNYDVTPIISPHIVFGPYVGFMVNAERVRVDDSRRDLDDFTREVDTGLLAGIGTDIRLGDYVINAQIRGALGLSSIFSDEEMDDGEKHRYFSVLLGFTF